MSKLERLIDTFSDKDLDWKPQTVGEAKGKPWAMIICYVTARAIQRRLDEVFGPMGWRDSYTKMDGGYICTLTAKCPDTGEWVSKQNGAESSDIEPFKGGLSGAFKRVAASGFGIGRYLYDLDTVFAETSPIKKKDWKMAKTKTGTTFWWMPPLLSSKMQKNSIEQEKTGLESYPNEAIKAGIEKYKPSSPNYDKQKYEMALKEAKKRGLKCQ